MSTLEIRTMKELLKRVVRIETRLVRLAGVLGKDVSIQPKIRIDKTEAGDVEAYVESPDVPLNDIIRACEKEGYAGEEVAVYVDTDTYVCSLLIPEIWR